LESRKMGKLSKGGRGRDQGQRKLGWCITLKSTVAAGLVTGKGGGGGGGGGGGEKTIWGTRKDCYCCRIQPGGKVGGWGKRARPLNSSLKIQRGEPISVPRL